ncbi:hypothetical protein ACVITL_005038 [Rhizobium pisi]
MSRCYTQITLADRRRLHQLVAAKVPVNEMARQLGRHRSTIYREIKRNTFRDRQLPDYDGYYSTVAHDISKERRRRLRKLRRHPNLRTEIINQLEARWSPEQIAGRLLSEGLSLVRVCKETIYRFIYSKEDYGLGQYLPESRRKRRPLRSRKPRDGAFPATHRISHVLISLEIDRSLGIGRATSSSLNVHSDMPMSRPSWSAEAAIPFSSRIRAGTHAGSWTRSSEHFLLYRRSCVKASHLIAVPSLPDSGLWKKGSARVAGSATRVHRGKKGQSRTPTSAFAVSCQALRIWQPCHNTT